MFSVRNHVFVVPDSLVQFNNQSSWIKLLFFYSLMRSLTAAWTPPSKCGENKEKKGPIATLLLPRRWGYIRQISSFVTFPFSQLSRQTVEMLLINRLVKEWLVTKKKFFQGKWVVTVSDLCLDLWGRAEQWTLHHKHRQTLLLPQGRCEHSSLGDLLWHSVGGGPAQSWMLHLVMEMPVSPAGFGQWKWGKLPAYWALLRTRARIGLDVRPDKLQRGGPAPCYCP